MTPQRYPSDKKRYMRRTPQDPFLVVKDGPVNGELWYHNQRDERFPYLYKVKSHPLVHNTDVIKNIYVYIEDTSIPAMQRKRAFEKSLKVPLGPDGSMAGHGLFEIEEGSVIYVRKKMQDNTQDPRMDVVVAWVVGGRQIFNSEMEREFLEVRDGLLGDENLMTPEPPVLVNNKLVGGTALERSGIQGIKGSRCFTNTLSHQHPRDVVGITASAKIYDGEMTEMQLLRKRMAVMGATATMESMEACTPKEYLELLKEHSEVENNPRIGIDRNVVAPAQQINIASAVTWESCKEKGLEAMGHFGTQEGHIDCLDCVGCVTTMMAMSRLPPNYEDGRFHLLALGVYVRLDYMKILAFCGLNKHGGTPPIAPRGQIVAKHASRMTGVMYPPEAMMNGSGSVKTILASLGKGYLELPPEVTGYASLQERPLSNEANWATDGESIMEDASLFRYVSRGILQLTSHILMQLPPRLQVLIQTEDFLNSISMVDEHGHIITASGWAHAPNGAHADTPPWPSTTTQVSQTPTTILTTSPDIVPFSSLTVPEQVEDPTLEADSNPQVNDSVLRRRDHHLKWLSYCETVSAFIPSMLDHSEKFGEIRKSIEAGTRSRRILPRATMKSRGSKSKRKEPDNTSGGHPSPKKKRSRKADKTAEKEATNHELGQSQPRQATELLLNPTRMVPNIPFSKKRKGKEKAKEVEPRKEARQTRRRILQQNEPPEFYGGGAGPSTRSLHKSRQEIEDHTRDFDTGSDENLESDEDSDGYQPSSPSPSDHLLQKDLPAKFGNIDLETLAIDRGIRSLDEIQNKETSSTESESEQDNPALSGVGATKRGLDRIEVFLKQLTQEAILSAANDFDNALRELNATTTTAEVISTATSCNQMIHALNTSPQDLLTASLVSDVLKGLDRLENFVGSQMVELRISRSLVMYSTWSLYSWPDSIVRVSMASSWFGQTSWVDQLVHKVWHAVADLGPTQPEVVFFSRDFIPHIDPPMEFSYTAERYRSKWTPIDVGRRVYYLATAIIRHWMGFPGDEIHLARYTFLDAFLTVPKLPTAILYLDPLWNIYQNPRLNLLRGTQKTRSKNPQEQYNNFRNRLSHHPIVTPGTNHFQYLHHLQQRSIVWYNLRISTNVSSRVTSNSQLPTSNLPHSVPLSVGPAAHQVLSFSPNNDDKRQIFCDFLCKLLPLIENPDQQYPSNTKLSRVAKDPDYYLPFRQHAPSVKQAMEVLYSDLDRIYTAQGFANILAFRGIFFGSDFARESLQYFESKEEWNAYYSAQEAIRGTEEKGGTADQLEKKPRGKKKAKTPKQLEKEATRRKGATEDYFRDIQCYGAANPTRSTSLFDIYWDKSTSKYWEGTDTVPWEEMIRDTPSATTLFHWLTAKNRFPNIGPLAALLLVGDLIEAGALHMPSSTEWGELVEEVNKGAEKGLLQLKLIPPNSPRQTIIQEFKAMDEFLLGKLTQQQRDIMDYSVVMLEHGLCKHPRFLAISCSS